MADYPQTVLEFNDRFHDEAACRAYLESFRWPTGPRCPRCPPQGKVWTMKAPFYRCAACGHDFTVTAGTLFADTHLPLRLWFQAMWHVVNQKNGASALGVQRVLGFGSYRTAWNWLHKLRRAMVRPGRDGLSGTVEMALFPLSRTCGLCPVFRDKKCGGHRVASSRELLLSAVGN